MMMVYPQPVPATEISTVNTEDLSYWYQGIDEGVYAERIVNAAWNMPTPGKGYCAAWVSYVYQDAGLGFLELNANEMCYNYGVSRDLSHIREGMVIAVPRSPSSELGWQYGHAGILVKNTSYTEPDNEENRQLVQDMKKELLEKEAEAKLLKGRLGVRFLTEGEENPEYQELQKQIYSLTYDLNVLQQQISQNYAYLAEINGFVFRFDRNNQEEWLVIHSTDRIEVTPLSQWISYYNITGEVAWGWGHINPGSPVEFKGDLAKAVPFIYHEENENKLKEIYGFDPAVLTDEEYYNAIAYHCASVEGAPNAMRLYGGAIVDTPKFYELLGNMTSTEYGRWYAIIEYYRLKEEAEAAAKEAEQETETEEETTEEETSEEDTTEENSTEETTAQETTVNETAAGETLAEQPSAEETPAEEPEANETTAQEAETTQESESFQESEPQTEAAAAEEPEAQTEPAVAEEPETQTEPASEPVAEASTEGTTVSAPETTAGAEIQDTPADPAVSETEPMPVIEEPAAAEPEPTPKPAATEPALEPAVTEPVVPEPVPEPEPEPVIEPAAPEPAAEEPAAPVPVVEEYYEPEPIVEEYYEPASVVGEYHEPAVEESYVPEPVVQEYYEPVIEEYYDPAADEVWE